MKALVLLSGGMDSTTALAKALSTFGMEAVEAISVQYGSVHQNAESAAAEVIASYYEVHRRVLYIDPDVFNQGNSALMGKSAIPDEEYHDIETETPSATVVPFRNANFISQAVAVAEGAGYDQVWIANHATDSAGFAYPDCTPEFMGAMAAAVYIGTLRKVRLVTPFQQMSKAEIVGVAADLEAPLHLTWSCYRGAEVACGQCPTCLERIRAFAVAGYVDPINYAIPVAWDADLVRFPVPS